MEVALERAGRVINIMKYFLIIEALVVNILIYFIYADFSLSIIVAAATVLVIAIWFILFKSILRGNKNIYILVCFIFTLFVLSGFVTAFYYAANIFIISIIIPLIIIYFLHLLYFLLSKSVNVLLEHKRKQDNIKWLYSWYGKCVGYEEDNYLWSSSGEIIGKSVDSEIYSKDGMYLGELYSNGRLVYDKTKADKSLNSFECSEVKDEFEKPDDSFPLILYPKFLDFLYDDEMD